MQGWEASGQAGWTEAWLRVDWSEPVPRSLAYSMGHVEQLKYSGRHKTVGLRKVKPMAVCSMGWEQGLSIK